MTTIQQIRSGESASVSVPKSQWKKLWAYCLEHSDTINVTVLRSSDYSVLRDEQRRSCNSNSACLWSQYLSGKEAFSGKPGIAIRFYGGETLRKDILKNNHLDLVAIEVPDDADKRWKARKHLLRR